MHKLKLIDIDKFIWYKIEISDFRFLLFFIIEFNNSLSYKYLNLKQKNKLIKIVYFFELNFCFSKNKRNKHINAYLIIIILLKVVKN